MPERPASACVPRAARDYLLALAQRIEVDAQELRIDGIEKRTAAHACRRFRRKTASFGVSSSAPKWSATVDEDEQHCFAVAL
jgi:site-specific DNA recombinase